MQYIGGKWKAGKRYAEHIAPCGPWWEPFCGGLNVTMHLARSEYPGLVSDVNPDLVALFEAVRAGWEPPTDVSREQWAAAKTDPAPSPLRTFIGFGCSTSGEWFGSYARPGTYTYASSGQTQTRNYAAQFAKALRLQVAATAHCGLRCLSFFDVMPVPAAYEVIYCDPPYAGTMGYGTPFDHAAFWKRCVEWARTGTRVLVSEYACPIDARLLWQRVRKCQIGQRRDGTKPERVECLFQVEAS